MWENFNGDSNVSTTYFRCPNTAAEGETTDYNDGYPHEGKSQSFMLEFPPQVWYVQLNEFFGNIYAF